MSKRLPESSRVIRFVDSPPGLNPRKSTTLITVVSTEYKLRFKSHVLNLETASLSNSRKRLRMSQSMLPDSKCTMGQTELGTKKRCPNLHGRRRTIRPSIVGDKLELYLSRPRRLLGKGMIEQVIRAGLLFGCSRVLHKHYTTQ
jgi:hypothetical protein